MEQIIICNTILYSTIVTASYLGFGIANAYVSAQNVDAKNKCGIAIWYCLVIHSAMNFLAFLSILWYLKKVNENNTKRKSTKESILALCINIWACVAYFNADSDCNNFYLDNYPQVWYMLKANVIYLFVNIGVAIVMYILTMCLLLCIKKK
jgi:hypothetical protein